MPDFRRISQPGPSAATVHIFKCGDEAMARITWPASDGSSSLISSTVGRELPASEALEFATEALGLKTVEEVVVLLDDDSLWDQAWGRLAWGPMG